MSVDLGHSSPPTTPSRYPKRKRPAVLYAEPQDDEGLNLDMDSDADNDEQFGARKKARKAPPKQKAVPRQKIFPFMSLPPELRNKIYELALIDPNGVHIRSVKGWYRPQVGHCSPQHCLPSPGYARFSSYQWLRPDGAKTGPTPSGVPVDYKPSLVPALLATCKTINAEAAPMFWGQPFYVADMTAMHAFLVRMSPVSMALMREVTIITWSASRTHKVMNMPTFGLLRGVVNLQRLTIFDTITNVSYRISRGPDGDAERAKQVARKVWRDCFPWLEVMLDTGGIEAVGKVFKLAEDNFKVNDQNYSQPPSHRWTEERRIKSEHVMLEEIKRLMESRH
ncbi:hypothetical protein CONLIGDRAFT_631375 [Coniochaeta ligniaria NRRL 30616]|uniref:2EXR domain-containing protein n=1 Tax=Coniochaeta ligniaria NRRL 30616 TaxID=1408157 RepID=A0A1J7IUU5_9PEZI|nr:hypothetical protein CONLIGDRAFT_631375 [Coniochaeta ligniaria NRRL 30616]